MTHVAVNQNGSVAATTLPLTERILAQGPGSRLAKLMLWGAIPVVRAVVLALGIELSGRNTFGMSLLALVSLGVVGDLVLVYAVLHAIRGIQRLVKEIEGLEPTLSRLIGHAQARPIFRGLDNAAGPIIMTTAVTLILAAGFALLNAGWVALISIPLNLAIFLPLATLIWTYLMLMAGLNRLGKEHLALETYNGDRSLGLRPVGKLAFSGLWTFVANLGPVLLLSITYWPSALIALGFFIAGIVAFFLSVNRLHQQMARARQQQIVRARELYAQAFAPLASAYSLESLKAQAPLLGAAEALEKRAETIQQWPFDDRTLRIIAAIVTSVVIAIITKLIVKPLGL